MSVHSANVPYKQPLATTNDSGRLLSSPSHAALYPAGGGGSATPYRQPQFLSSGVPGSTAMNSFQTPLSMRGAPVGGHGLASRCSPPNETAGAQRLGQVGVPQRSPFFDRACEGRLNSLAECVDGVNAGGKSQSSPSARPTARRASVTVRHPPLPARDLQPYHGGGGGANSYVTSADASPMGGKYGSENVSSLDGASSYFTGGDYPTVQQQHLQTPGGLSASRSASKSYLYHTSTHNSSGRVFNNSDVYQSPSPLRDPADKASGGRIGGFQATYTGNRLSAPGADGSPGVLMVSPPSCGLNGVTLEKQLLSASKEELVQMLLELGSCNADAATFISSKASFFAFRHRTGAATEECQDASGRGVASAIDFSAVAEEGGNGERREVRKAVADTARRLLSGADHNDSGNMGNSPDGNGTGGAEDASFSINASPVRSEGGAVANESRCSSQADRPPRAGGSPSPFNTISRQLPPQERAFSAELHPCLRWYGACRNSTSCVFAAAPQNLCLNWVRGSCAAGPQCNGVHRLPDVCPPEVRTIFELSNGRVSRQEAMSAMVAVYDRHRACTKAADDVTTPQDQILHRDQDPFSSCGSPRPNTDRFVSSREDTEEDEEFLSDGQKTPIGPHPTDQEWSAAATSSPFRDYFAPEANADTVSAKKSKFNPSSSPAPAARSANLTDLPTAPQTKFGKPYDSVDVHRSLDDSFERARDEVARNRLDAEPPLQEGTFRISTPPPPPVHTVDSPIEPSGAGEDEYDNTAPCVGTHTRTHTPERSS